MGHHPQLLKPATPSLNLQCHVRSSIDSICRDERSGRDKRIRHLSSFGSSEIVGGDHFIEVTVSNAVNLCNIWEVDEFIIVTRQPVDRARRFAYGDEFGLGGENDIILVGGEFGNRRGDIDIVDILAVEKGFGNKNRPWISTT